MRMMRAMLVVVVTLAVMAAQAIAQYVDHSTLPRVVASSPYARDLINRASSEYVTGIMIGDSRATWGGQGGGYLNAINLFATQTYGIPKWSEMLPIGLTPPAGYNTDPDGSLRSRMYFTNSAGGAGSTASGYDKAVSKALSMPGFPNQACSQFANPFISVMPEARISHRDLFAHAAPVFNRSTSILLELWANGVTYPYNDGTTNWTGAREFDVSRGYTVNWSRTSITPGYINNDAANQVAVGGFGNTTTAFGAIAAGAVGKWQVSIPYKADTTGHPFCNLFSLSAGSTLMNVWGYRFQDPTSTTGLSFTPNAVGGYTFASIPANHASCAPQLVALCEKSTLVVLWIRLGVNDVFGSGHSAATISTNVAALVNFYRNALPDKQVLAVWDGFTPRLDDGNPNYASTYLPVYRTLFSAVIDGFTKAGVEFIAVNGGRLQEEMGWTVTNETIAAVTGAWAVGTAYTAGQVVSVTQGDLVRFFQAVVNNTGFDPTQDKYRGQWIEVKDVLGGGTYNEGLHPQARGEIICARLAWQAVTGMPHYSADGRLLVPVSLRNRSGVRSPRRADGHKKKFTTEAQRAQRKAKKSLGSTRIDTDRSSDLCSSAFIRG